jgi:hypothetical protein
MTRRGLKMSSNPSIAINSARIGGLALAAALLNWLYGYDAWTVPLAAP